MESYRFKGYALGGTQYRSVWLLFVYYCMEFDLSKATRLRYIVQCIQMHVWVYASVNIDPSKATRLRSMCVYVNIDGIRPFKGYALAVYSQVYECMLPCNIDGIRPFKGYALAVYSQCVLMLSFYNFQRLRACVVRHLACARLFYCLNLGGCIVSFPCL